MTLTFLLKGEETTITNEQIAKMKLEAMEQGNQELIKLIKNSVLREAALTFWREAPEYFFVIPASSSGKYHWAKEIGGLFNHVLMGMHCAYELARTFGLTESERDLAIVAVAGHDCLKYGINYDTRYFDMHPFLPRSYYAPILSRLINTETLDTIFSAIERHMGDLCDGTWTSIGRLKPETPLEQVVHLADYMSSRENIVLKGLIR